MRADLNDGRRFATQPPCHNSRKITTIGAGTFNISNACSASIADPISASVWPGNFVAEEAIRSVIVITINSVGKEICCVPTRMR